MKNLLTGFLFLAAISASSQTLFTYGNQSVSADEFLRAFRKNNNDVKDEKALKEYLDLYIASRLKIREAKDEHYDTLPQLANDLANLRQQVLPAYLNDKQGLDKLVNEAFARSQKDIHLAHIFISFNKNGAGTVDVANTKRDAVLAQLAKGARFEEVAKQYSDDPSAATNAGDLGWITAFTLPYELENLAYTTSQGKTSPVYASKAGYHIFKNLGERKAAGRIKTAQILLAFPPSADETLKARLKKKADSLYTRLLAGDDFGKLATLFSNDVISSVSNGQMQEFGVGEYNTTFETAAFALQKNGAITKPFLTEHGYHIVKRLGVEPVNVKLTDEVADDLRRKIETSDRIQTTKTALSQRILKEANYKKLLASDDQLWLYSDSVFNGTKAGTITISSATPVFKIGDHTVTVKDWTAFGLANRYKSNGTGLKPYKQLWDEFVQTTALQHYEEHLEDYNEDFKRQITEFAEGNLFFEIMQRRVWTPAQTDSAALEKFYQQHKSQYVWKASADAVIFYVSDPKQSSAIQAALKKSPANWKAIVSKYSEQVTTDSGRFELAQIPKGEKEVITKGLVTTPQLNKADNSTSFAYIVQLFTKEEPRNFNDAKGLVINDYQSQLEKEWIESLKKKYPVTVNENVWKEVLAKANSK